MKRRSAIVATIVVLALSLPGIAQAAWIALATGTGSARATSMPSGSTPSVSALGRNVTVSWTAVVLQAGPAVAGYTVARYDAGTGTPTSIGSACSGTIGALTCTENGVPAGSWQYTVTPWQGGWSGTESAKSATVTLSGPGLTFGSPTTISTLPSTLNGTLSGFTSAESLTWRLDDPSTGTILTGSAGPTAADGTATVSVTIPTGTGAGAHTVHVIGSGGSQASAGITVVVDAAPPAVSAAVIAKSSGGKASFIAQGGQYYVYANAADVGSPSTGISSVVADVSTVTTGANALTLSAGSYVVDGVTYGYRSAVQTVKTPLSAGSKSFTVTATDGAGKTGSGTFSVTVDNSGPAPSDVQATNASGGTAGKAETGDQIVYTFTEAVEPTSILASFTGASATVVVRFSQPGGKDTVQVFDQAGTTQLPLGSILLNGNFASGTTDFTGSTMTVSGATVTITLGTPSKTPKTATGTPTMAWTSQAGVTDLAGNACTVATVNESGAPDLDL